MARTIKIFKDGSILEYGRGSFDDWCVYLTRPSSPKYAPRDKQYFSDVKQYAAKYSLAKVYSDFVAIYDVTGNQIEQGILNLIEQISSYYQDNSLEIEIIFAILYAGMVAEENKQNKRLGKRIKRLGLHQVLFDSMSPAHSATFSRGKNWREIAAECQKRGF